MEETAKECDRHLYPDVSSLFDIFISLPVSVASAKRSFSTLRKLKTWLRAQMGQTRLSGLALLNVHRNTDISIDKVIDRFANSGARILNFACKQLSVDQVVFVIIIVIYENLIFVKQETARET